MCKNFGYVENLISENKFIYIDTCSILDTERLLRFIKNYKDAFINNNKKILVLDVVINELAKFRCADNEPRKTQATRALEIIDENKDLFAFEDKTNRSEETFADPILLKELLENRRNCNQLLISNDSHLTSDAFNFNKLGSFNGGRINVCYINYFGDMHMCDCVKERDNPQVVYVESEPVVKEVIKEVYIEEKRSSLEKYGVTIASFIGGITVSAIAKPVFKHLKNVDWSKVLCH